MKMVVHVLLCPSFLRELPSPSLPTKKKKKRQRLAISLRAACTAKSLELPLFPLPLVLFPGAVLPLQIFEYRYRIMMHTILQTDLRFGVAYTGDALAKVGCVAQIVKHERFSDNHRFVLLCKGQERFRVMKTVRTKPYYVAEVELFEDGPCGEEAEGLANEVELYMKDIIRISNRLNGKEEEEAVEGFRKKMSATDFSLFVGSTFEGDTAEQQALLELEDTTDRLMREKEILRNTLNYLSAKAALKDAFP